MEMENEPGVNPESEIAELGIEELTDKMIDVQQEITRLEVDLHEAEFPTNGEPDKEKVEELRGKINELNQRLEELEAKKEDLKA